MQMTAVKAEPLTYEQEVHALLHAAASNTEDLLRYFEAQAASETGEAKELTKKCIQWKRDDLRRIRELIPQALERRDAGPTREHELAAALEDANSLCRSAHSIAERKGLQTNWDAFLGQLNRSLKLQHKVMYPAVEFAEQSTPLPAVDPSEPPRPPQPPDNKYCPECGGGIAFETVGPGMKVCSCPPRKITPEPQPA